MFPQHQGTLKKLVALLILPFSPGLFLIFRGVKKTGFLFVVISTLLATFLPTMALLGPTGLKISFAVVIIVHVSLIIGAYQISKSRATEPLDAYFLASAAALMLILPRLGSQLELTHAYINSSDRNEPYLLIGDSLSVDQRKNSVRRAQPGDFVVVISPDNDFMVRRLVEVRSEEAVVTADYVDSPETAVIPFSEFKGRVLFVNYSYDANAQKFRVDRFFKTTDELLPQH